MFLSVILLFTAVYLAIRYMRSTSYRLFNRLILSVYLGD